MNSQEKTKTTSWIQSYKKGRSLGLLGKFSEEIVPRNSQKKENYYFHRERI